MTLLHRWATEQARRRPRATAVAMGETRVSYEALEAASNRLARALAQAGCGPGERVCLLAPKHPQTIVAMLATLKVGGAYVPIDLASPVARSARIVRSADPAAAVVLGAGVERAAQLVADGSLSASVPLLEPSAGGDQPADALPQRGRAADPAHILFTSGSTGQPKGVVITHANVDAFVGWAVEHFQIGPGDRLSGHPPLHFDLSTFDVYATLRAGAELHLVPEELLLPRQLAELILARGLTQWFSVPSAMSYMARHGGLPPGGFPSLRRVLWCGEVMPVPVLAQWMQAVPQASFTNLYGPTETTIASSHHTLAGPHELDRGPVPIGRPCQGEELFVVDGEGRPLPDGEAGELWIAGAGLSPGYWRDPETTRAAFVPDPRPGRRGGRAYRTGDLAWRDSDGLLHFLGRRDSQIKSRGYRIELGEIEAALNGLPEVAECAVVAIASQGFEGSSICCAFSSRPGHTLTVAGLRDALRGVLPAYMLPSRWEQLAALPRNANGKLDRRRLAERFAAAAGERGGEAPIPVSAVSPASSVSR